MSDGECEEYGEQNDFNCNGEVISEHSSSACEGENDHYYENNRKRRKHTHVEEEDGYDFNLLEYGPNIVYDPLVKKWYPSCAQIFNQSSSYSSPEEEEEEEEEEDNTTTPQLSHIEQLNHDTLIIQNDEEEEEADSSIEVVNYKILSFDMFYNSIKTQLTMIKGLSERRGLSIFTILYNRYKKRNSKTSSVSFESIPNKSVGSGKSYKRKVFIIMKKYLKNV